MAGVYSESFFIAGLTTGPPPTITIGSVDDGYTYVIRYFGAFNNSGGSSDDMAVQVGTGQVIWFCTNPTTEGGQSYISQDCRIVFPGGTEFGFTYSGDWTVYCGGYKLLNA